MCNPFSEYRFNNTWKVYSYDHNDHSLWGITRHQYHWASQGFKLLENPEVLKLMLSIWYCNHASMEEQQREERLTAGSAVMLQGRYSSKRSDEALTSCSEFAMKSSVFCSCLRVLPEAHVGIDSGDAKRVCRVWPALRLEAAVWSFSPKAWSISFVLRISHWHKLETKSKTCFLC